MAVLNISPIIANPSVQTLGGSMYLSCETRSVTAPYALASAGTSTLIQITNSKGTVEQTYTAMSASSTGSFYYVFVTALTMSPGKYSIEIKTTDGGIVSIARADFLFELVLSS